MADVAAAWHHDDSKLEERASQVTLNAEGGLETSAVTPGPTPTEDLDDPYVDNFMAALQLAKGVRPLMIITRADNSNTVVYAANLTGPQTVDESKPIDYFWADIEPKTIDELRKAGTLHNRTEFGMLDNMGYGLDVQTTDGVVTCSMTAMPKELKQEFKLVWVGDSPRLGGVVNGVECWMEKLYIKTKKRTLNPIPKILYVRIWGTAIASGEKLMQQVEP